MIYKFIDNKGTFTVKDPQSYNLYFPLTNKDGSLLSSISPNLGGDIKENNERFLTPPASIVDIKSNFLCRRDFFIKIIPEKKSKKGSHRPADKEIIRLSYPYCDTLEAGFLYHKIIKETANLRIEILNFIPYNLAVEIMWVRLINKSSKELRIVPTSFVPLYARGEKNLRDHRHVSSLLNRIHLLKHGILLKPTLIFDEKKHKANETVYFCLGFENEAKPPIGQFPTLDRFLGQGNFLHPDAIEGNLKPTTKKQPELDGKEAAAAFRFRNKTLKRGEETNYFLIMGINSTSNKRSTQKIMNTFGKLNSPSKIKQSLEETKKYWHNYLSRVNFDFQNKDFNGWLLWVKLQPTLRKLFGCSFLPHFDYGKGGRGWRDLWQDALTLLLNEPTKAKDLILNSFGGIKIDGSNATIITKNNTFVSDRNQIGRTWMDHGVWPYITLRSYLNKTGDLNILNRNLTFFKDHLLSRGKEKDLNFNQKDHLLRTKDGNIYLGSMLEHILIQHLVSFFNTGEHNIIRLENADWNDGLDMAPDKGESAAFSFMYAHNLKELCCFLEKLKSKTKKVALLKELILLLDKTRSFSKTFGSLGKNSINYSNPGEKQKRLEKYLEAVKCISGKKVEVDIDDLIYDLDEKSRHLSAWLREKEWLKAGFFNGYYDNKGRRAEGKIKGKTKMMLASQVFAIMSGTATTNQIKRVWASINKYLKDNKLNGFHLNTNFDSLYLDLGRAFGFSYGDKENGAFFNHMAILLGYALYKQGFTKEGWEVINSVYKMATANRAKIYPLIPEYFNNQGEGLYLYLTGSASWFIYTLMEEALGIKYCLGDIFLEPKLMPSNFFGNKIKVNFHWEGKKINIFFVRKRKLTSPYKIKEVFLEEKMISKQGNSCLIKRESLRKIDKKEIRLKIHLA